MTEDPLFEKAIRAYRRRSTVSFAKRAFEFAIKVGVEALKDRSGLLRYLLGYERVAYNTAVGTVTIKVPKDSYYTRRAPNTYDPGTTEAMRRHVTPSDVVYDVGSSFGYYALVARRIGVSPSRIHAFERDAFRYFVLRRNCGRGFNLRDTEICPTSNDGCTTISDYAEANEPPDVLRIPLDERNLSALLAAEETLTSNETTLIVVVSQDTEREAEDSLLAFLRDREYSITTSNEYVLRLEDEQPNGNLAVVKDPATDGDDQSDVNFKRPYTLVAIPGGNR